MVETMTFPNRHERGPPDHENFTSLDDASPEKCRELLRQLTEKKQRQGGKLSSDQKKLEKLLKGRAS